MIEHKLKGGRSREDERRIEIDVDSKYGSFTAVFPSHIAGYNVYDRSYYPSVPKWFSQGSSYQETMEGISKEGLLRPTTKQIIQVIDLFKENIFVPHKENPKWIASWNQPGYFFEALDFRRFWSATESRPTENGVLVYDNVDGKMSTNPETLIGMAKDKDPRVRFVRSDELQGFHDIDWKTAEKLRGISEKVVCLGKSPEAGGRLSINDYVNHSYIVAQNGGDPAFTQDIVAKVGRDLWNDFLRKAYPIGCKKRATATFNFGIDELYSERNVTFITSNHAGLSIYQMPEEDTKYQDYMSFGIKPASSTK